LGSGSANYVVTGDGTLVYAAGVGAARSAPLTWVDRLGRPDPIAAIPSARFSSPRLSADDRRVLVSAEGNVRIYDLATGRETRVTTDGSAGGFVAWRPDDDMVAYSSRRTSKHLDWTNVWLQHPDGSGAPVKATALEGQVDVDAWSPDGRTLAVHHHPPSGANSDIFMVPVSEGVWAAPRPFAGAPAGEINVVFSPDGRYVAYRSNETGVSEVYIRPFDGAGPKTTVSVGGASDLAWARNGEIFYRRPKDEMLIAVAVATTPRLAVGQPIELFKIAGLLYGSNATRFAVASDGKRLLMPAGELPPSGGSSGLRPAIQIVLNWAEELKNLVPRP
jgi:Tol biopolymer transport system component